jgi:hypothetical protein
MVQMAVSVFVRRDDLGMGRSEATATYRLKRELSRQPERRHGFLNGPPVNAGIDQGRQRHVAGNAAKTVEIADSHAVTPCPEC